MSGLALYHQPYADWLKSAFPWTRGQVEYLFILNAGAYLALQWFGERFSSPQLRMVAKAFRFVVPGHVLIPLLSLSINAMDNWKQNPDLSGWRVEARVFEILLPLVALVFVYGSIPKQMKNYFAAGMLFLAVGIIRLSQDLLETKTIWPVALLVTGMVLMLAAGGFPKVRFMLRRFSHRRSPPPASY